MKTAQNSPQTDEDRLITWCYVALFIVLLYVAVKTVIDLTTGYVPTL